MCLFFVAKMKIYYLSHSNINLLRAAVPQHIQVNVLQQEAGQQKYYHIKLLKSKRNVLYIRNRSVPRCKHFQPRLQKTNQLMMYTVKIAVCSEIHTKHSNQSEHHVEFLNVKPGGM